jgi:hypothetical protein
MIPLFKKLNLKDQAELVVLNAPESFEAELKALEGIKLIRDLHDAKEVTFLLAFVTKQKEVDALAQVIAKKAKGDALVWFAYPKGTSKKYHCEFNRDTGWAELGKVGFEGVRMVAIDQDWSALRFRRVEFVKNMACDTGRAMTTGGKAKLKK